MWIRVNNNQYHEIQKPIGKKWHWILRKKRALLTLLINVVVIITKIIHLVFFQINSTRCEHNKKRSELMQEIEEKNVE